MASPAVLARKWQSLATWPWSTRLLVPPAIVMLGLARLATVAVPFRHYVPLLGPQVPSADVQLPPLNAKGLARARAVGRAIRASAQITPWRSVCLQQAMVASVLLRLFRVPHVTHLGVAPDEAGKDALRAHAWVVAGPTVVTGRGRLKDFAIVASYARRAARRDASCSQG